MENTTLLAYAENITDFNTVTATESSLTENVTMFSINSTVDSSSSAYVIDEADDAIWILTSTFIIFTMQSGFGLLESGSVTPKNEVNIMVKNSVDVVIGGLSYWAFGYGLSFGEHRYSNPFCGWGNFFVNSGNEDLGSLYSKFFFQASFATTATTIVSGAMAERTRLEAYIVFSFINTVVYCMPAHWVWDQRGFLHTLGIVDVAGAGPVHLVGGITGLVSTLMLKPRYGRYNTKYAPPMGSPTNALLGMFMLWWGWLGFNCGSTFGISGFKWKLAARSAATTLMSSIGGGFVGLTLRSAVTTILASTGGGFVSIISSYLLKRRKFDVTYIINGVLGSLVGITALCALAQPWEGAIIGAIGAMLVLGSVELLDKLKVDDPVGVVGVHAVGAAWSLISVGFFARSDDLRSALGINHNWSGIFYGGNGYLLGCQLLGILTITAWTAVTSFILLKIIDLTIGLRVKLQEEILGADLVEHAIGDIQYDKVEGRVTQLSRGVPTATDGDGDDDEGPCFNEARKRRHSKLNQDLVRKASQMMVSGRKGASDIPEETDGVYKQTNGHVSNGGHGLEIDPPQRLTLTPATISSRGQNGQNRRVNTLWKFAVGKTMNKDERARRANARENISLVLQHTKILKEAKVTAPSPLASARKFKKRKLFRNPSAALEQNAGERWRLAQNNAANGHVNKGLSVDEEYQLSNRDRSKSYNRSMSAPAENNGVVGDIEHLSVPESTGEHSQSNGHYRRKEQTIRGVSAYV